jgi:hypothetical protein
MTVFMISGGCSTEFSQRANQDSLPNYGERQREGEPIRDRWNRWTVQPFLAVRIAVLNDSLADSLRDWFPGFRPVDPKVPEPLAA